MSTQNISMIREDFGLVAVCGGRALLPIDEISALGFVRDGWEESNLALDTNNQEIQTQNIYRYPVFI